MQVNASPASPENESDLSPKQDKLISALLAGHTIVAAAKIAGVNETTAHAWLKLDSVQTAYKAAQRAVFDDALSQLMLDVGEARTVLKSIMKNEEVPASTRVRAAQIILEQAIEQYKTSELEQRIAELEQALQKPGR